MTYVHILRICLQLHATIYMCIGATSVQKGRHSESAALGLLDRLGQVRAAAGEQRSEL